LARKGRMITGFGLSRALRDFEPDVVHCSDILNPMTLLACHYKERFGYRLFLGSVTGVFGNTSFRRFVATLYMRLSMKYLRDHADGFFATSEGSRVWLFNFIRVGRRVVGIVPLGADLQLFKPDSESRGLIRNQLGLSDEDVLLIMTGKFTPAKDVHVLISSLAELPKFTRFRTKLILVGS